MPEGGAPPAAFYTADKLKEHAEKMKKHAEKVNKHIKIWRSRLKSNGYGS